MRRTQYENVIIVTRNTELDDLIHRFNTKAQAKFYLEQAGQSFQKIQEAHDKHQQTINKVRQAIPNTVKSQTIRREYVPRFMFGDDDLIITVGQDGLVKARFVDPDFRRRMEINQIFDALGAPAD